MSNNEFNLTHMKIKNIRSHYKVNISNDKAELYEKIVYVKLLVIVIIVFKRYPRTCCLMHGRCFICTNLLNLKNIYLKIRITTFNNLKSQNLC